MSTLSEAVRLLDVRLLNEKLTSHRCRQVRLSHLLFDFDAATEETGLMGGDRTRRRDDDKHYDDLCDPKCHPRLNHASLKAVKEDDAQIFLFYLPLTWTIAFAVPVATWLQVISRRQRWRY